MAETCTTHQSDSESETKKLRAARNALRWATRGSTCVFARSVAMWVAAILRKNKHASKHFRATKHPS